MKQKSRCHKNSEIKLFGSIDLISENLNKTSEERFSKRRNSTEIPAVRCRQGATRTNSPSEKSWIFM